MTISDEELLISPAPSYQQQPRNPRVTPPQTIHIECHAEERHIPDSYPANIQTKFKPMNCTADNGANRGKYRSEIVVHKNPDTDLYIKRLRVAFGAYDDASMRNLKPERSSIRSQSVNSSSQGKQRQQQEKYRSISVPRKTDSHAALHQWIDDICLNEQLMNDDDICFYLKNGEFLARI